MVWANEATAVFDAFAQHRAVRLQGRHAAADLARHLDQRVDVVEGDCADYEHGFSSFRCARR
jgi:hypothetical protein